jgi:hypothetical protein
VAEAYCDPQSLTCVPALPDGDACSDSGMCLSGSCQSGTKVCGQVRWGFATAFQCAGKRRAEEDPFESREPSASNDASARKTKPDGFRTSRLGEPGRVDFLVAHLDAAPVVVGGNHQQGIAAGRKGDQGGGQRAAGFEREAQCLGARVGAREHDRG